MCDWDFGEVVWYQVRDLEWDPMWNSVGNPVFDQVEVQVCIPIYNDIKGIQ